MAAIRWRGVIDEFRDRLPIDRDTPAVTLHEGGTPLVPAPHLSSLVEREVFLKVDGANPTGSFKDRGMTVAVTRAAAAGSAAIMCASTGNTAASAAAYAARAGLPCFVVLPAGQVAAGKLAQAVRHGARIVQVDGSFDDALSITLEVAEVLGATLVNSVNPDRIAGQQSVAWEIVESLHEAPAVHVLPVGNAGNITATWQGYREVDRAPRMWGFQAEGAAPLVSGRRVERPETIATAIRIGDPASREGALAARDESDGLIAAVADAAILAAYDLLASKEGVFAEPASAAAVAGLLAEASRLPPGAVVVTLTGHGLKDPGIAVDDMIRTSPVPATASAVAAALQG